MRQRGVALLQVLFILALLVPMVASIQLGLRLGMAQTQTRMKQSQVHLYLLGGESIASEMLRADLNDNKWDNPDDGWTQRVGPLPLDAGREGQTWQGDIGIQISDLSGRFNLNWMHANAQDFSIEPNQFVRWVSTDQNIEPPIEPIEGAAVRAITDWFSTPGANDFVYASQDIPFKPGSREMTDVSELRRISNVSRQNVMQWGSLFSALPAGSLLNINFSSKQTLQAVQPKLSSVMIDAIIAEREKDYFTSLDNFGSRILLPIEMQGDLILERLSVSSDYFLAEIRINLDGNDYWMSSVLKRTPDNQIHIVSRHFLPLLGWNRS